MSAPVGGSSAYIRRYSYTNDTLLWITHPKRLWACEFIEWVSIVTEETVMY